MEWLFFKACEEWSVQANTQGGVSIGWAKYSGPGSAYESQFAFRIAMMIYIEIPERKFPLLTWVYRIIWMNSISEVSIKSIHIIIIINYDVLIWFWCIRWEMSKYIAGWARSYDDDGNSSLWDTMCSLAGQWLWVPKMPTKSTCSMHLLELEVCPRFRTSELFRMNLYRRYLDRMHQRKFPIYCCFGA